MTSLQYLKGSSDSSGNICHCKIKWSTRVPSDATRWVRRSFGFIFWEPYNCNFKAKMSDRCWVFYWLSGILTCSWSLLSQGNTNIIRSHPVGTMNVWRQSLQTIRCFFQSRTKLWTVRPTQHSISVAENKLRLENMIHVVIIHISSSTEKKCSCLSCNFQNHRELFLPGEHWGSLFNII